MYYQPFFVETGPTRTTLVTHYSLCCPFIKAKDCRRQKNGNFSRLKEHFPDVFFVSPRQARALLFFLRRHELPMMPPTSACLPFSDRLLVIRILLRELGRRR